MRESAAILPRTHPGSKTTGRSGGGLQLQKEREGRALPNGAADLQLGTMKLKQFAADRQPEAGATVLVGDLVACLRELLENVGQSIGRYADSRVAHANV